MDLTLAQWCVVFGIVAFGALAQSVVGFGLNLLAAPVVGIVAPDLLPAAMVVVNVPLSLTIATRGRRNIDWSGVKWTTLGRLPGTVIGAAVVVMVSTRTLGAVVGGGVLIACVIAMQTTEHQIGRNNAMLAGSASGFMDTAAAVGGPPLALLYQHRPAPEVRATLSTSFLIGTALSLVALVIGDKVDSEQLMIAASLIPALAVGMLVARPLTATLGQRSLRPVVLGLSCVAGLGALINATIG